MSDFEFTFQIQGAERISKTLREMPGKLKRKDARRAARAGMAIVRDAAKANARQFDDPATRNAIHRLVSIRESGRESRRVNGVVMRVGIRGGARSQKDTEHPWYWRLLEFGTQNTHAQPFMRPAFSNNLERATDRTVQVLNQALDRLVSGGE